MKTRQRKPPAKKRSRRPVPHRAAQRRPAAARGGSGSAPVDAPGLALSAACTAAEAESLKTALAHLLETPQPVTLDVGTLQRIDTAGLQLLAAFVRDRRTAGRQVEWRGRAPVLDEAAALLGLRCMLELPGEDRR